MEGFKTYIMGGAIILHQILKLAGLDISDEMISQTTDAVLALGAIVFRWQATVREKQKIREALYTPVPKGGGPQ